jgi:hypothetical protein
LALDSVVGVVLCFIPGPGIPFLFVGGGLLAMQSLTMARFLDKAELAARRAVATAHRTWARLSMAGKLSTVVAALVLVSAVSLVVVTKLFR